MTESAAKGVLLIYTGGTIGSLPRDRSDPFSPLEPAALEEILDRLPNYDREGKRLALRNTWIPVETYSWETPLDSSNISMADWIDLAKVIQEAYRRFEGFVVLHGTDTLAYTASALAFMLENLAKPVVLTGSVLPISQTRSDAVQNLVTSIEVAAAATLDATVVPEVSVCFGPHLYRGCRSTKLNANSFDAFDSPNFPPLADIGEKVMVNLATPIIEAEDLKITDHLEANIASLDIFPNMSPALLRDILCNTGLKGVVLNTFGSGNAPSTPDFLAAIEEAIEQGTVIVNVTQCSSGEVELGLYEASAGLLSRGVVTGMDMTREAALTKMSFVLAQTSYPDTAADMMQLNLKGEQRRSLYNLHYPGGAVETETTITPLRPMVGADRFKSAQTEHAVLRIIGIESEGRAEFSVYRLTAGNPNRTLLGRAAKKSGELANLIIPEEDIGFVDAPHELVIVSEGSTPFRWSRIQLACFAP